MTLRLLATLLLVAALPSPLHAAGGETGLRDMIGQMLLVGFRGATLDDDAPILRDIRERNLGGVILFDRDVLLRSSDRNIESPEQVRALTARLQAEAATPLFIAVDQEGGRVRRLKEERGFPPAPSARAMGQAAPAATRLEGERTGELLAGLGVNVNFAPVVDVDVNHDSPAIGRLERSFSADPDAVADHALEFCRGQQSQGVLSCLKHFPGHGGATEDSHLGLTDVSRTWTPAELRPYEVLIPLRACPMVMAGHLFVRQLDDTRPASLSTAVLTGLLRRKLGFEGLIVSDDMQMKAITAHYGAAEAMVMAVAAGTDILVFGNNLEYDPDIAAKAVDTLERAVMDGRLPKQRIQESFRRIQAAKRDLNTALASFGPN
jgi:beta-N-acetylhexosaminidase